MYEFDSEWLQKLASMREGGTEPYPNGFEVRHTSTELHAHFVGVEDPTEDAFGSDVAIGGRVLFRNRMGRAMFLRIQDRGEATVDDVDKDGNPIQRGGVIQVYLRREEVGEDAFAQMKGLDIGDFVWVRGFCMRTRTRELSVQARECALAGKIMRPFPDRRHGLTDIELRSRQRYADLMVNPQTRDTFRTRSRVVRHIREFFEDRDYIEVETPMLQVIPGGAAARPFVTHHNALDMPLYMRIAPELYLKRLVVGGFDRVFEINRNFRNEGISIKHNPEFTMLEFYQAWATYLDLMDLTETLISGVVERFCGGLKVQWGDRTLDFSTPWRRADMDELISEATGLTREALADPAAMEAWWREHRGVEEDEVLPTSRGKWWEVFFDAYVEDTLINPTFVTGFPTEISPLSRRNDADPERVDRFELIINGWELANGFSELNDPVDQAERFADQAQARTAGDDESMFFDGDYIDALTFGMPPTAGQGIGIDRLVMLLTDSSSIREVILFPTLRPDRPSPGEPTS